MRNLLKHINLQESKTHLRFYTKAYLDIFLMIKLTDLENDSYRCQHATKFNSELLKNVQKRAALEFTG